MFISGRQINIFPKWRPLKEGIRRFQEGIRSISIKSNSEMYMYKYRATVLNISKLKN